MSVAREEEFDIEARHAEVVGENPRIQPLANDEIEGPARDIVEAIRVSAGAGPISVIPEYMRTVVKHPEIFRCQMDFGAVLFKGMISPREREIAILRIGWLCRAPFEFGEHVNIAKRCGITSDEIERARQGSSAGGWSEHEAAILKGVEELLDNKAISQGTWDVLAKSWDEAQLIEFPMMVGQYVATAFVQNSLCVRLEPTNPGLTAR